MSLPSHSLKTYSSIPWPFSRRAALTYDWAIISSQENIGAGRETKCIRTCAHTQYTFQCTVVFHLWAGCMGILLTWQTGNLETAASSERNLKDDGLYSSRAISSLSAIISGSSCNRYASVRTHVNTPPCIHHILYTHLPAIYPTQPLLAGGKSPQLPIPLQTWNLTAASQDIASKNKTERKLSAACKT